MGPAPILGSDNQGYTGRIAALATDPTNGNVIYVGAASGGVWKTTDGGQNWSPKTDFQASLNIGAIAVAPSNPSIIYAGTGEGDFVGLQGKGVLKSSDGGNSWTLSGQSQFSGKTISAIVVDPTNANRVLLTIADGPAPAGIWRTLDGGTTWTNVALSGASMTGLVMDPTNAQILYAAAGWVNGNAFNGVYRSTDGGTSWSFAGNFPSNSGGSNHVGRVSLAIARSAPGTLYSVIADPSNGQNVYKVMKTTNGNTPNPASISWQSVGDFSTFGDQLLHGQGWYGNVVTVDPFNANVVYAAGYKVWKSTNGGASWAKNPDGNPKVHDDQHALAFILPNDVNNHKLIVGTDGGLYRLDNPSTFAWSDINGRGMQITQFYHVGLDPTTADIAYGASQDNGVEKFQDNRTWQGEICCDGLNVAVSPTNHNRVYASYTGGGPAVFNRSDNGGASYTQLTTPGGSRTDLFVVDPGNGDRVLMGGSAVYESTNAGASWAARNGAGWPGSATIENLAVSPSSPNTIYVIASVNNSPGTYVTTDDGQHWQHFNSPGNDDSFWGLAADPANNQTAYALTHAGHVYRTTNGGQTWANITGNLPPETAYMIAVKSIGPANSDKALYVGNDIGVYASYDMGASWSRAGSGLPNAHVTHVEVRPNLNVLAAGTYGRGLWELQVGVKAFVQNGTLVVQGDDGPNIITLETLFIPPLGFETAVWEGNSVTPRNRLVTLIPISSFNRIEVDGLGGNDTINVEDTIGGKPVTVNLGNGTDTVNISPSAHNLDNIGTVTVNGGQGIDTLNVYDQSSRSNNTYSLNNGHNVIVRSGSGGTATINYSLINSVNLNGGSGANRYDVFNTSVFNPGTVVSTGNGNDIVNIDATTGNLTVNLGTGRNTVNVSPVANNLDMIHGNVTVHGGDRVFNTLQIWDNNNSTGRTYTMTASTVTRGGSAVITYAFDYDINSVDSVIVNGGSGANIFEVQDTNQHVATTINDGSSADVVNVRKTSFTLLTTAALTVNGSFVDFLNSDVVNVGNAGSFQNIQGSVAITDGRFATTRLNVDDSADTVGRDAFVQINGNSTGTIGNLTGLDAVITFPQFSLAALTIKGGSGANTFTVHNTGTGFPTMINTGNGNNAVNVWATTGDLTVNLGSGRDMVKLSSTVHTLNTIGTVTVNDPTGTSAVTADDSGFSGSETYVVTSSTLTIGRASAFRLTDNGVGTLNVNGSQGGDSFDLSAGTSATAVMLQGGGGSNTLVGANAGNSWEVTGADTGTLSGPAYPSPVSFQQVGNLTAGSGGDYFLIDDQAWISGNLSGGGSDTLDYSPYSTLVEVDLQLGIATGVGGSVSSITTVLGGNGNGTQAENLLIGNGGDTLIGGFGRSNILVAGGSGSTLIGGDSNDLLIGGTTAYDTDPALAAWGLIADYWAGTDGNTDDYATRVANLMSGNGVPLLDATTVTGNGGGNTMNGNGALALIYSDGNDTITGFDPNSQTVPITP
jgi:photosystem II stability/assembly factor-like uncharacterized protein